MTPSAAELVRGIGEMDWRHTLNGSGCDDNDDNDAAARDHAKVSDRSYLLLDVREEQDYLVRGHLVTAVSYPISKLNLVNFETSAMLAFKNRPGKIIVLCDLDESLACRGATTLVQRGYENVLMLSGGLKVAELKFPVAAGGGLVTRAQDAQLLEDEVVALEESLDEAMTSCDRVSSYAPSVGSVSRMGSRAMSVSQPNLAKNYDRRAGLV
jgi:rhodanese-related sulfurtransferase